VTCPFASAPRADYQSILGANQREPWLLKHPDYTHPVKEDVKKKVLSAPLAGDQRWCLTSSPAFFLEGLLMLPLLFAA